MSLSEELKATMINFLGKIKQEGKIGLIEPSNNISQSYLKKASDCLKAAKLLLSAALYENSVSESYYSMYNCLLACLFRCGIKCENHTASIMLVSKIFGETDLMKRLEEAKKERIDKQYYVTGEDNAPITRQIAEDMIKTAENVNIELRLIIDSLGEQKISFARDFVEKL